MFHLTFFATVPSSSAPMWFHDCETHDMHEMVLRHKMCTYE